MKVRTESFARTHSVAIREGRVWIRSNDERAAWELLGGTGLPPKAKPIREVSADGDNLIAIDADGVVHYMKFSSLKWTAKWGKPFSGTLHLPENRGWAISHRGPDAGGYEDIAGHPHSVSAGVTTLYALSADGLRIPYADPWLPPDFSHELCGPLRGRLRARALSASASTVFVLGENGAMYTRLADFDTVGDDPILFYSYARDRDHLSLVRILPAEDWKEQPRIDGKFTSTITISQTGKGNAARELRVEGASADGTTGYFTKAIDDAEWKFVATGEPLRAKPLVREEAAALGPSNEREFAGSFGKEGVGVELAEFNPVCSPARLRLNAGGESVELLLHHRRKGSRGALELQGAPPAGPLTTLVQRIFKGERFRKVKIDAGEGELELRVRLGLKFRLKSKN